ncbi:Uncharacterised protein [Pseudomonas putida]|uniref:Uncharacterized protein n=1 Tax=Pseudomonas putida TaxID=303 RepID=A0A379KIB8_PSEPU|nr:Uncharacterised protein [Pseudomonas putida]
MESTMSIVSGKPTGTKKHAVIHRGRINRELACKVILRQWQTVEHY